MKKILTFLFLCCFLLSISIQASAHPGGTDWRGGHHNRSTGEYHYHHGYSAHDHYDIDGDGDADCPYDYKNKPNQRSNNSKTTTKSTTPKTNTKPTKVVSKKKELSFIDILLAFLFSLTMGCIVESIITPLITLILPEDKVFSVIICSFWIITITSFIFILRVFF